MIRRRVELHQISPFPQTIGQPFRADLPGDGNVLGVSPLGGGHNDNIGLVVEVTPGDTASREAWFAAAPVGFAFALSPGHSYLGIVDYKDQMVVVYQVEKPD